MDTHFAPIGIVGTSMDALLAYIGPGGPPSVDLFGDWLLPMLRFFLIWMALAPLGIVLLCLGRTFMRIGYRIADVN